MNEKLTEKYGVKGMVGFFLMMGGGVTLLQWGMWSLWKLFWGLAFSSGPDGFINPGFTLFCAITSVIGTGVWLDMAWHGDKKRSSDEPGTRP